MTVEFVNDQDVVVRVPVHYEWKPIKCTHCQMYGHLDSECRKQNLPPKTKQVWRPVAKPPPKATPDADGFIQVTAGTRPRPAPSTAPSPSRPLHNAFAALNQVEEVLVQPAPAPTLEGSPPNGHR